ncbi:MAG: signal recognition particle protein [Caulobacterales bacterium]|nr:signal recognition particle protein [Caulobacterales bacterium]
MFDTLSERLTGVFDSLTGRGALSEKDVEAALREVRVALLEADVALPVVKDFITKVREDAVGEAVVRSVTPGQQVVKIVHDALVDMLGGEEGPADLNLTVAPPAVIMMAGLQGSGKTTTAGKIALKLKKAKQRVLLASLDTRRPAAMEQLKVLSQQAEVDFLPIIAGQTAVDIAKRAMKAAELGGQDVLILDTAGRTSIDEELMSEAAAIAAVAGPHETLLVADALTGQDAVETARRFHERLPLTGLVLTRVDGDGRGGAALSMRAVTGLPIKFLGVGEKLDGLETFEARRIAGRILGQGDVVSLVEKATEQVDQEKAEKLAKKMAKGKFDLDDMAEQFKALRGMGGLGAIMGMLPGMGKMKAAAAGLPEMDDTVIKRQEAIISSMTRQERARPEIIKSSRKRRIAKGAGVEVPDVNKVLKMHRQMSDMVKKMGRGGMKGLMDAMGGPGGGAMPPGAAAALGGGGAKSLGMGRKKGKAGPALPGLPGDGDDGGGLPGFPGGPLGSDGLPLGLPRGKK